MLYFSNTNWPRHILSNQLMNIIITNIHQFIQVGIGICQLWRLCTNGIKYRLMALHTTANVLQPNTKPSISLLHNFYLYIYMSCTNDNLKCISPLMFWPSHGRLDMGIHNSALGSWLMKGVYAPTMPIECETGKLKYLLQYTLLFHQWLRNSACKLGLWRYISIISIKVNQSLNGQIFCTATIYYSWN